MLIIASGSLHTVHSPVCVTIVYLRGNWQMLSPMHNRLFNALPFGVPNKRPVIWNYTVVTLVLLEMFSMETGPEYK
jgi:hypothetical protein